MLDTLHKIGEELLETQSKWAQYTTEPKFKANKKNWVCPILFDCIDKEVKFFTEGIELFKEDSSSVAFRYIPNAIWGPRGKKCALTVEVKNFQMLEETLFGKDSGDEGSMMRSIEDYDVKLLNEPIFIALNEINETLDEQRSSLNLKEFKEKNDLGKQEEIVLFYAVIKSTKINNGEITPLFSLEGYEEFIIGNFYTAESGEKGLDYVTGEISDEVTETAFAGRYNIHKIFQTTASNFASGFSDFQKNFQTNSKTVAALDKASEYVLSNLQTQIAGVTHIMVPSFLHKELDNFDIEETELFLDKSSDLLFQFNQLAAAADQELPDVGDIFWINYFAYESDGNSFKIINHIKDVNSQYLKKVIEVFAKTGIKFRDYIGGKYFFNLQSSYYIIPIRDPNKRSKINPALTLFKDILEHRVVSSDQLFHHFIQLTLCHWYGRYAAFSNISKNDSFDFAIKDAVFKYSALIYALKQLNLIDMENIESPIINDSDSAKSEFQKKKEKFFIRMDYSEYEKAMFYLGRVLSAIAYAQYEKKHESKPVLNKINFNGMDAQAVLRLSLDLANKTVQYNIHGKTDWNFARFRENFNEKKWPLSKEQNVFYLMVGYSFGLTK